MLSLFLVLTLGVALGALRRNGFALGSAGVLIVAMIAGSLGARVNSELGELGLVLFIYSVGLQAGPRFFRAFAESRAQIIIAAAAPTVIATGLALLTFAFAPTLNLETAVGVFSGSVVSAPALAAVIDTLGEQVGSDGSEVSVAYGLVFPIALVTGPVVLQLIASLRRVDLRSDAQLLEKRDRSAGGFLEIRHFKVTNPNCIDRPLSDIHIRSFGATVSRLSRDGEVMSADPALRLAHGDVLTVVCTSTAFDILLLLFGEESEISMELGHDVVSVDLEITIPELTGKPLASLDFYERYKLVITRLRRQGIEFSPDGSTVLQIGDFIRIVGSQQAVEEFRVHSGSYQHRMVDTNMLPLMLGMLLGVGLGCVPIHPFPGLRFRLGPAGGCFLASLLIGHYGRIGPLRMYVPAAARNLVRELGLLLFLASVGAQAGGQLDGILTGQGIVVLAVGALLNLTATVTALLVPIVFFRRNFLEAYGMACGALTNSLPLGYARERSESDQAALAYANVYPLALIFKIIAAHALLWAFRLLRT